MFLLVALASSTSPQAPNDGDLEDDLMLIALWASTLLARRVLWGVYRGLNVGLPQRLFQAYCREKPNLTILLPSSQVPDYWALGKDKTTMA